MLFQKNVYNLILKLAINESFSKIRKSVGEIPIVESEQILKEGNNPSAEELPLSQIGAKGPKVLADGTYATESAYSSKSPTSPSFDNKRKPSIRGKDLKVFNTRVHSQRGFLFGICTGDMLDKIGPSS